METEDQRQHPRRQVFSAIMITPNGDHHAAQVVDLSAGGARTGLPDDWSPRQARACGCISCSSRAWPS